jgi:hypothetical protein
MNHQQANKHIRFFLILFCLAVLCAACPTGDDIGGNGSGGGNDEDVLDYKDGVYTLTFTVPNGQVRYLNLNTAEWVTDSAVIASPDWDIAFHASRLIYTNSGDTATDLNSGGFGGVWFTNATDFDAVTSAGDKQTSDGSGFDYSPYFQDAKRWLWRMDGCSLLRLNVMTYAGYPDEATDDGLTEAKAFAGSLVNYDYNKKQYYWNPPLPDGSLRMPPAFEATGQVYIIRHGNSADHSKLQVSWFYRNLVDYSDSYTIQWETFDDE